MRRRIRSTLTCCEIDRPARSPISSGQLCTVEPIGEQRLAVDDIVLCRVKGAQYLHLIKAIQGDRFQIGNNRGGINGWVTRRQIFGRLIALAP